MRTQEILVTPEMAQRWLEANDNNRPLNQGYVDLLSRDMKAGRWKQTHEGIAFDKNGRLLDGQHRLWAAFQAQVPVELLVCFDLLPDSVSVVNTGKSRNAADVMKLTGRHPPKAIKSMISRIHYGMSN